ncbi:MAG: hypothetical protein R2856_15145 [Caldilineaceae bacterium]
MVWNNSVIAHRDELTGIEPRSGDYLAWFGGATTRSPRSLSLSPFQLRIRC